MGKITAWNHEIAANEIATLPHQKQYNDFPSPLKAIDNIKSCYSLSKHEFSAIDGVKQKSQKHVSWAPEISRIFYSEDAIIEAEKTMHRCVLDNNVFLTKSASVSAAKQFIVEADKDEIDMAATVFEIRHNKMPSATQIYTLLEDCNFSKGKLIETFADFYESETGKDRIRSYLKELSLKQESQAKTNQPPLVNEKNGESAEVKPSSVPTASSATTGTVVCSGVAATALPISSESSSSSVTPSTSQSSSISPTLISSEMSASCTTLASLESSSSNNNILFSSANSDLKTYSQSENNHSAMKGDNLNTCHKDELVVTDHPTLSSAETEVEKQHCPSQTFEQASTNCSDFPASEKVDESVVGATASEQSFSNLTEQQIVKIKLYLLRKELELRKARLVCWGCGEKQAQVTFMPCGHLVVCSDCSQNYNICPKCNHTALAEIKTYLA